MAPGRNKTIEGKDPTINRAQTFSLMTHGLQRSSASAKNTVGHLVVLKIPALCQFHRYRVLGFGGTGSLPLLSRTAEGLLSAVRF
jgi:hypothetical protein